MTVSYTRWRFYDCIGQMPSTVRPYIPWNLLNMPAGIVPMTKVTKEDDFGLKSLPNNDMVISLIYILCKAKYYLKICLGSFTEL